MVSYVPMIWLWRHQLGWSPFDEENCWKLERAYIQAAKKVSFATTNGCTYIANFDLMIQQNTNTKITREIRRTTKPSAVWYYSGVAPEFQRFSPEMEHLLEAEYIALKIGDTHNARTLSFDINGSTDDIHTKLRQKGKIHRVVLVIDENSIGSGTPVDKSSSPLIEHTDVFSSLKTIARENISNGKKEVEDDLQGNSRCSESPIQHNHIHTPEAPMLLNGVKSNICVLGHSCYGCYNGTAISNVLPNCFPCCGCGCPSTLSRCFYNSPTACQGRCLPHNTCNNNAVCIGRDNKTSGSCTPPAQTFEALPIGNEAIASLISASQVLLDSAHKLVTIKRTAFTHDIKLPNADEKSPNETKDYKNEIPTKEFSKNEPPMNQGSINEAPRHEDFKIVSPADEVDSASYKLNIPECHAISFSTSSQTTPKIAKQCHLPKNFKELGIGAIDSETSYPVDAINSISNVSDSANATVAVDLQHPVHLPSHPVKHNPTGGELSEVSDGLEVVEWHNVSETEDEDQCECTSSHMSKNPQTMRQVSTDEEEYTRL